MHIYLYILNRGMPMLTVGIRRYTTKSNRGFAFGLFYSVMNIGAFVSGPVVDVFNINIKNLQIFHYNLTGNRLVILTATLSSCISLVITIFFVREIRVKEEDDEEDNANVDEEESGIGMTSIDSTNTSTTTTTTTTNNNNKIKMNKLTKDDDSDNISSSTSFLTLDKTESMVTDVTSSSSTYDDHSHNNKYTNESANTVMNPIYTQGKLLCYHVMLIYL